MFDRMSTARAAPRDPFASNRVHSTFGLLLARRPICTDHHAWYLQTTVDYLVRPASREIGRLATAAHDEARYAQRCRTYTAKGAGAVDVVWTSWTWYGFLPATCWPRTLSDAVRPDVQ